MQTRYLRGNTAALNRLSLPKGGIAIDLERKAIRFYDGETLGGYEALGGRDYLPPLGPGSDVVVAGGGGVVYYGTVPPEEFLNGSELSDQVGLSAGTAFNTDIEWLKFLDVDRVLFTPKLPLRYGLSYDQLVEVNAVSGEQLVSVGPYLFRLRLMTGLGEDSEWNRLLYPLASTQNTHGWDINIPDVDLGVASGNGSQSWVQELDPDIGGNAVLRGGGGITSQSSQLTSSSNNSYAWRPMLELTTRATVTFPVDSIHHSNDFVQAVYPYHHIWTEAES